MSNHTEENEHSFINWCCISFYQYNRHTRQFYISGKPIQLQNGVKLLARGVFSRYAKFCVNLFQQKEKLYP